MARLLSLCWLSRFSYVGLLACLAWSGNLRAHEASSLLVDALCDKQVVALGELPSHGEASAFQFKAAVVRGLVEQCGFDAVLFEAPIYDFLEIERAGRGAGVEQDQLDNAIGRFWWVQELADWRRWLMAPSARRRLVVGGLDDQLSATSTLAAARLPELVASRLPAGEGQACEQAVRRNLLWSYDSDHVLDAAERRLLYRCASVARDSRQQASSGAGRIMLDNLASYYRRDEGDGLASSRDEVMYQNVIWHIDRLPPDTRVIIWTANTHAARGGDPGHPRSMGAMLAERFGAGFVAVGGTAFEGWSRMAGGPLLPFPPAAEDALEREVLKGPGEIACLGAEHLNSLGATSSRLLGRFTMAKWAEHFDWVYIIRRETAPTPAWPQ